MQRMGGEVGDRRRRSWPRMDLGRPGRWRVRHFSPLAEVPLARDDRERRGAAKMYTETPAFVLATNDGEVPVTVTVVPDGLPTATDVGRAGPRAALLVGRALEYLGWRLDVASCVAAGVAFRGRAPRRGAGTDRRSGWPTGSTRCRPSCTSTRSTLQLVWREGPRSFRVRHPFAVGGVVEDPATGAAAAAFARNCATSCDELPAVFESSRAWRWAVPAA